MKGTSLVRGKQLLSFQGLIYKLKKIRLWNLANLQKNNVYLI